MNILCKGCIAYTAARRLTPHNILFCNSQHPSHNKPSRGEMTKILEKYFGCPIGQKTATDQVGSGTFTCTQTKKKKKTTSKRKTRSPRTAGAGDTIYLIQWVRVGGKPTLVMYDRGSNTNLVLRKIAQEGKMKTISSEPNIMTVAGGHKLTTRYGSFRVEIGPLITGGDRFLDCQGG